MCYSSGWSSSVNICNTQCQSILLGTVYRGNNAMSAFINEKFKNKSIGVIKNPVLIVGQNPGKQRKNEQTFTVWEGNKSSDLLNYVIENQTNVYLTNVCNYQEMTPQRIEDGINDLRALIDELQPVKVICLGAFAHLAVCTLKLNYDVKRLLHPSYIVRFQKDREAYKNDFISVAFHV